MSLVNVNVVSTWILTYIIESELWYFCFPIVVYIHKGYCSLVYVLVRSLYSMTIWLKLSRSSIVNILWSIYIYIYVSCVYTYIYIYGQTYSDVCKLPVEYVQCYQCGQLSTDSISQWTPAILGHMTWSRFLTRMVSWVSRQDKTLAIYTNPGHIY